MPQYHQSAGHQRIRSIHVGKEFGYVVHKATDTASTTPHVRTQVKAIPVTTTIGTRGDAHDVGASPGTDITWYAHDAASPQAQGHNVVVGYPNT